MSCHSRADIAALREDVAAERRVDEDGDPYHHGRQSSPCSFLLVMAAAGESNPGAPGHADVGRDQRATASSFTWASHRIGGDAEPVLG